MDKGQDFGVPGENDNGCGDILCRKGDSVWVTHILSTEFSITTQKWQRVETVWRLKSGAGEEGYSEICTGCEGGERDGTTMLYCEKSG